MAKTFPDIEWGLANDNGNVGTWNNVAIAVLMDIRRELRKLNNLLGCANFIGIPSTLRGIRANTAKPKRKKAVKRG